ncbi:MAG: c-type cytochrome [Rhodobacteraceae bacterium]|nr:c-type cytochrome [Paracoccaceae bacterium]
MNKVLIGLVLAGGLVAFGWAYWPEPQAGQPYQDAGITTQGREIYAANCASCHGADLQGEPDWRRQDEDGFLPAPPHDQSGHTWHHPDTLLIRITRDGTEAVVGGSYRSRMIGFGDILAEDEIIAVLAYIKSTWPEQVIAQHNKINTDAELSN